MYWFSLLVRPASNSSSFSKVSPTQSTHTLSTKLSSRASFPGLGFIHRPNSLSPLIDRALSYFSNYTDAPIVRWLRTHSDDPWSAGKRLVVFIACGVYHRCKIKRAKSRQNSDGHVWVSMFRLVTCNKLFCISKRDYYGYKQYFYASKNRKRNY